MVEFAALVSRERTSFTRALSSQRSLSSEPSDAVNACLHGLQQLIPHRRLSLHYRLFLQDDLADLFQPMSEAEHQQLLLTLTQSYDRYPAQHDLRTSTVFHFSNDMSKFSPMFLELLHSVYHGSTTGLITHYRINLVKASGHIHGLEFSNQENYWRCIRSIILIYRKIEINEFQCFCKVGNTQESSKKSVLPSFKDPVFEDCMCLISGSTVVVSKLTHPEETLFSTDIGELAAITLSVDHDTIKPYLLQISCGLQDSLYDESKGIVADLTYKIVNANNGVVASAPIRQPTLLPVSLEEAVRGEHREGVLSIHFAGSKLVPMINTSNYYNPELKLRALSEGDELLSRKSSSKTVQEHIGCKIVSLPVISYVPAYRLVIKRGVDLNYQSKDDSLPSPYCVGYLLDGEGNKMTKNSVEHRTAAVNQTLDPVWDREMFFLKDPSAACVHVKVRTHRSYFSKEEHIGQVSIPIDCFVEGVEAHLCLPLEPTYR